MKPKRILILIVILLLMPPKVFPQEHTEEDIKRWSGSLELWIVGFSTTSQIVGIDPDDVSGFSNDFNRIDSLEKNSSYETLPSTFFLFDVNYTLNATTSLYLETPLYHDERMGLSAGIQKLFQDSSLLDLSLFIGGESLWKDPYLTGVARETTEAGSVGLFIDYDGINETEWNVTYILRGREVADDLSGDNNPALKRSGITHTVKTGYNLFLNDRFDTVLTPRIIFIRNDWEGGAYANNGFGGEVNFAMEKGKHELVITGAIERLNYDDTHPVFHKERSDWLYRGEIYYTRKHLWGSNWYTRVGCWLMGVDSDIDFFDENSLIYGISMGYSFE